MGQGGGHPLNGVGVRLARLVCPRDHGPLARDDGRLVCAEGHSYACAGDVPILLLEEAEPTQPDYWAVREEVVPSEELEVPPPGTIDPYVLRILRGTCGNLYADVSHLPRYPIPNLRLPVGSGQSFLELGSNWGRWCIAAARKGYAVTGIDPSLGAVRAARRVARQLDVPVEYVVADARHLPFADASFDVVFSYSVLQHLGPADVHAALAEVARVLSPRGTSLHQLPNAYGLRNLYQQARRGFRRARAFEVRYWRPREALQLFDREVGPSRLEADGFFSLNAQPSDADLVPARYRHLLRLSEGLRKASELVPPIRFAADSLTVVSAKRPA